MNGFIAYNGPSMLDGSPILGIVTLNSSNPKTGNMAQLWIIRSDMLPTEAVKTKKDSAICGSCIHKHNNNGACYVQPFQAPNQVYKSYLKGNYLEMDQKALTLLSYKALRLGAYGDPAMLPDHILKTLTENSRFYTGYTHQWKNKRLRHALKYCQASVDKTSDIDLLKSIDPNAKYFRVATNDNDRLDNEIECLSDSQNLSCIGCKLCNGKTKDIVINVHGTRSKRFINDKIIEATNV